jgi:NAD(P)-dependent dehydrogenase (short-subunit alcohol dehydrogenase family)
MPAFTPTGLFRSLTVASLSLSALAMSTTTTRLGRKSTAQQVVSKYGGPGALAGKTAVVTGGASGIGLETAKALAYAGARVIIASRGDSARNAKCDEQIRSSGRGSKGYAAPEAQIEHKHVDLSDLSTVCSLADELRAEPSIDLLVLNAGVMALPKRELSSAGFEKQLAVNHFAHQLLFRRLEDKLRAQPDGCRVVVLSSTAHTFGKVDPSDLHYNAREYSPWGAYGQSKCANLLFAKSVAERHAEGSKVTAVSVHPGVIRTPLWRHIPGASFGAGLFVSLFADKSIEQGAATTVYACLAPECARPDYAGAYLSDCSVAVPSADGRDASLRKALWKTTEEQLAAAGFPVAAPAAVPA